MHRDSLIRMLDKYGLSYPNESEIVSRFIKFIESEERCFARDCWTGHITGSAWLVDTHSREVLLTHHRKLNRWLQLGGHSDGVGLVNPIEIALREATEESGLDVAPISEAIFDIDIHEIPANLREPSHFHYDLRFMIRTVSGKSFTVTDESNALAWVPLADLSRFTEEESILRMADKYDLVDHLKYR